jgi:cytidylate kinase
MNLIFLFGPAAAGKLTVARALSSLTGYPVFHNHLIVDAVGAVFPFGSEPFVRLRQAFWLAVFADAAKAKTSLIFTFAPEPSVPADFFAQAGEAVERSGGQVRYVELQISEAEQDRRIENADRAAFQKLRSREILQDLRARTAPFALPPPAELVIDTEWTSPENAAAQIRDALTLVPAAPHVMYPES